MAPMKFLALSALFSAGSALRDATRSATNPLSKVLDLLTDLTAKIEKEGEAADKAYHEYFEWCDDAAQNLKFEIETNTKKEGKLEAKISELVGSLEASAGKIEDLAGAISATKAELKDATTIREKEASEFAKGEEELADAVDALSRATSIIEREMSKSPGSFAQLDTKDARSMISSLGAIIEAAGVATSDRKRLLALVQSQQAEADDDAETGAPAAAVYKSHSSDIFDLLEDMKSKAEAQLASLRKAETAAKNSYALLKQSLEAQAAADNKDLEEEKAMEAQAQEEKAAAEGELTSTQKALKEGKENLATTQSGCMQTASDHEASQIARKEELAVVAKATAILKETSGGAVSQSYSLVQIRLKTQADLANSEVVMMVKRLARKHHSSALNQLAMHVAAILKYGGANGEDVFAKVKTMIQTLVERLEEEAHAEATEKAYCDEQTAKTEEKKGELEDDIAKLTVKIDQATSRTAQLKEEVKNLENELSAVTKLQAEMDKIRQETNADFLQAKSDLEQGLSGVRKALSVLRNYYASKDENADALLQQSESVMMHQPAAPEMHSKSGGAGSSIIGILEVVESDFATDLAKETTQEEDAQAEYEKVTQENKVTKELKSKDVEYKTKEIGSLAKTLTELESDHDSSSSELAAVMEYYSKLNERCVAKPETYEERKQRREAEIAGLKEALTILENETALFQRPRHHRGIRQHSLAAR